MFIKSINWIDKNSQEADVVVSDNTYDLICFSYPFFKSAGEKLTEPLYCYGVENIVISDEKDFDIKKGDSFYNYFIRGKLINKFDKIVQLNNINLCLDDAYVPNDIDEGRFIEFDVARLNIF